MFIIKETWLKISIVYYKLPDEKVNNIEAVTNFTTKYN